jgi:hypothetical protein
MRQLILSALFVCSLFGQNAQISGFVKDSSDAAISAAKLKVINQDTPRNAPQHPMALGSMWFPSLVPAVIG